MGEQKIRLAAFEWLKKQITIHGDILSRKVLEKGFLHNGEKITLIGPQGIWKPSFFDKMPISITTVYNGPYDDFLSDDGTFTYRYPGTDPFHRDNVGLVKTGFTRSHSEKECSLHISNNVRFVD